MCRHWIRIWAYFSLVRDGALAGRRVESACRIAACTWAHLGGRHCEFRREDPWACDAESRGYSPNRQPGGPRRSRELWGIKPPHANVDAANFHVTRETDCTLVCGAARLQILCRPKICGTRAEVANSESTQSARDVVCTPERGRAGHESRCRRYGCGCTYAWCSWCSRWGRRATGSLRDTEARRRYGSTTWRQRDGPPRDSRGVKERGTCRSCPADHPFDTESSVSGSSGGRISASGGRTERSREEEKAAFAQIIKFRQWQLEDARPGRRRSHCACCRGATRPVNPRSSAEDAELLGIEGRELRVTGGGPVETCGYELPEHYSLAFNRCELEECAGTYNNCQMCRLFVERSDPPKLRRDAAKVQSGRDCAFRSKLVGGETPRAHTRLTCFSGPDEGEASCSGGRARRPEDVQVFGGEWFEQLQGRCGQRSAGLGVRPGRGKGSPSPEARYPDAGREERGGREDGAATMAARNCGSGAEGSGKRKRAFGAGQRKGSTIHGQSEASTSEQETETEGAKARECSDETLGETVSWIRVKLQKLDCAWLRHHTCATRDILPLPVLHVGSGDDEERLSEWRGERRGKWDRRATHLTDAWLEVVVLVLNSQVRASAGWWSPALAQKRALEKLWEQFLDFVSLQVPVPSECELVQFLRASKIDYHGELAVAAEELSWTRMCAALPPPESCGILHVEDICEGAALDYVSNPAKALISDFAAHAWPKPARVH
eukprot:3594834-Amphidinium_carterae.1